MTTAAILTAAGSGRRLGLPVPKALVELSGVPLVVHAAGRLLAAGCLHELVVTAPADRIGVFETALGELEDLQGRTKVSVVVGGPTRQASVAAALDRLGPDVDVVLVHDAARPMASEGLINRVHDAVRSGHPGVVPGLPVADTVKQVGAPGPDGAEPVTATLPRAALRSVQTPQGFARDLLTGAHAAAADRAADAREAAGDDATLVEETGLTVWVVPGEESAMKITTSVDLAIAELLLNADPPGATEIARTWRDPVDPLVGLQP